MAKSADAASFAFGPERILTWYLRLLSLVYLAVGLSYWLELLNLPAAPQGALLQLSLQERAEAIAYAVLAPIAAVGLWLTASWGVAAWLILTASRMVVASGLVWESEPNPIELAAHVLGVVVYVILWQLARRAAARRD